MTFFVPKRTQFLWQTRASLLLLTVAGAFFLLLPSVLPVIFALAVFLTAGFCVIIWGIPFYLRRFSLSVENGTVTVKRGVLFRKIRIIPYTAVFSVETVGTPLAKRLGLASVVLKSARKQALLPELYGKDVFRFLASFGRNTP